MLPGTNPRFALRSDLQTLVDVVLVPADAARRIVRDPKYVAALIVSVILPFIGGLLSMRAHNLLNHQHTTTIWEEAVSGLMLGVGCALWVFVCFIIVGLVTSTKKVAATAWALGTNASVVASGIPQLVHGLVIFAVTFATGAAPQDITQLLPSLGWLFPASSLTAAVFSAFDIFIIWQVILFSSLLAAFKLPAVIRWPLGVVITLIPPVVYTSFSLAMFSMVPSHP